MKNQKVNLFNRQRKLPIDFQAVRFFLDRLVDYLKIEKGFTVVLISDSAMTQYNRRFAGKNYATDVLSFPVDGNDLAGHDDYLGDVLISVEQANQQKQDRSIEEEINILSLHGVLHLLGYDHEVDNGEMINLEKSVRKELGLQQ